MRGTVLVAIAAAVGNMLQGWDNSTIAGAVLYIKKEFNLQSQPTIEGLIVAMSLIGGTIITTFSGPVSDMIGRRPMLILSSLFYFLSSLVMLWAPNVYVLLLGRLLDGFGIGLAVTMVPVYISETAPPEIRGQLNTLPQFMGSGGMFVSYCMVFGMSLMDSPRWRVMLGVLSIPSLVSLALAILFLPESPRWLVSKGKMSDAKKILQGLRGREDVSGELALLVEGLGVGSETRIEQYIIAPGNEASRAINEKDKVILYGPEEGISWVAKPVTEQSTLNMVSREGSFMNQLIDPMVTLFGSVHEALPTTGSGSMMLPTMASVLSTTGNQNGPEQSRWDEENQRDGESGPEVDASGADSDDDNILSPLLSRSESFGMRQNSLANAAEEGIMGIGGGWQLAYKWSEKMGKDGRKKGELQRVYLHEEAASSSRRGSVILGASNDIPAGSEFVQAAALVSQTVLLSSRSMMMNSHTRAPSVIQPPGEPPTARPTCSELFEPGVKRALIVGIGLQILQQVAGINGVLYYVPQILEEAGVSILLSNLGVRSDSASLLISVFTTFIMLPCIAVSMRLIDVAGRRSLLLSTIPILVFSLLALIFSNIFNIGSIFQAAISTASVMVYLSCFVMGFGAIPNILCAEIFPTRVRGLCITICALTYWVGNIIITYSLPLLLGFLGLTGVFGVFAFACAISWIFVFLKVPETKGMPLEVISEFFAVGATTLAKND